ncbi:MAG TPA: hypothetical protein PKE40_10650 [Arachnia sp.]|nr:hypothetical protein [Arachnia sp.]
MSSNPPDPARGRPAFSPPASLRQALRSSGRRATVFTVAITLFLSLVSLSAPAHAAPGDNPAVAGYADQGLLDRVILGDEASEAAHDFMTESGRRESGAKGRPVRRALPLTTPASRLGDQRMTVAVDPAAQNYLSIIFWGEDVSSYATALLVDGIRSPTRGPATTRQPTSAPRAASPAASSPRPRCCRSKPPRGATRCA